MDEMNGPDLGSLLRQHRRRQGLAQEDLAERAGSLSVNTISNIERGRTRPYRHTLEILSDALGLDKQEREALFRVWRRQPPHAPAEDDEISISSASSLSMPLTPVIGREEEAAAITGLLRRDDVRLLTLTGVGGVGKTRLAQKVAADLADAFPDGVITVSLAPLRDASLVMLTVAQALGLREVGSEGLTERLSAQLRGRALLLFLDNMEQVVEAGPDLVDFLGACSGVTALVTSRTALRVRGEREYVLEPLRLPQASEVADVDMLAHTPAVALFVERVRAVNPKFELTTANAEAVAAICGRLDGLPLAIELAAARSRLFPPQELLHRLGSRLELLTGGPKDLPRRQQTLRATFDWSYGLLSREVQTLFARLSVFAGGCTFESAEAVGNPEGELDLVEGMTVLMEKSLLRREDPESSATDEPRFLMLETIREFAAERLAASEEEPSSRRRHAAHFLALTEAAEAQLRSPDQAAWLTRLEREHDNLRAALDWSLAEGEAETALRLASSLGWFWRTRGYMEEGQRWLEAALALGDSATPHLRAKALNMLGNVLIPSDMDRATDRYTEALALWKELGDARGVVNSLLGLGGVAWFRGDFAEAERAYQESLDAAQEAGLGWETAGALHNLSVTLEAQGRLAEAASSAEEAIIRFQGLGDFQGVGRTRITLGEIAYDLGHLITARAQLEDALAELQELGDWVGISQAQLVLGEIACDRGEYDRALSYLQESLGRAWERRHATMLANNLDVAVRISRGLGRNAQAARLLGAVNAWRERDRLVRYARFQAAYEREIVVLRAALGEEAFRAAWMEGRALSPDQALKELAEL